MIKTLILHCRVPAEAYVGIYVLPLQQHDRGPRRCAHHCLAWADPTDEKMAIPNWGTTDDPQQPASKRRRPFTTALGLRKLVNSLVAARQRILFSERSRACGGQGGAARVFRDGGGLQWFAGAAVQDELRIKSLTTGECQFPAHQMQLQAPKIMQAGLRDA